MKFGKYLEERKAQLPKEHADHCIDYVALKLLLKEEVYPNSIKLEPTSQTWSLHNEGISFSELVSDRLRKLQTCEATFVDQLDVQVEKCSTYFETESAKLMEMYESLQTHSDVVVSAQLYQSVLALEKFVFLNYTGIVKILKKNDRHSGLSISEPYLHRVGCLPLVRAEKLSALKQSLMYEMSQQHLKPQDNAPFPSPVMMRSRSSNTKSATALPSSPLQPNQRVLVSLSGPHGTDIIGAVLDSVSKHNCVVEDLMFSRLYHNVTFGVLITLTSDNVSIFRDLADQARKWDAALTFDVPDTQATEPAIKHKDQDKKSDSRKDVFLPPSLEQAPYSGRTKYAATVLNQKGLTSEFLFKWTQLLLENKISVEKMRRLNVGDGKVQCADYQLSVPEGLSIENMKKQLIDLSRSFGTDVALQTDNVFRKNKRLVVFDMDSTLIQQEVIDEIARHAGVMDKVSAITEAAMNGEIDFKESLRRRVALLQGTNVDVLRAVRDTLTFTEGARFLCRALKRLGFKLAVISGGFIPLANYVKAELGLDYAFANQLKVSSDGLFLTGETVGPIVDGLRKAELLEVIAQAEGVTLDQVIAVGDGANDLWMLGKAGLGIAFNAKPRVQEQAQTRINQKSLRYVLSLLGYSDEDMQQLHDHY
ncbi:HAD-like domain-containing protein [Umbelopsis sp. AD052]|nr:HAD-like domain-containing protein [Umbelopsis sp. AD052]